MISNRQVTLSDIKYHWTLYLFVLPTLVLLALFSYYPAFNGIFHSFFNWNGADISEPVGLRNYIDLLKNGDFWNSFSLVFLIGAFNLLKMSIAVIIAVMIHRCQSEKTQFFYRVMFVIPMVVPGLIIVLIWRTFFFETSQGYLNQFLNATHLKAILIWLDHLFKWGVFQADQNPAWLGNPKLIVPALIIWGFPWVGSFGVLTHLAKLQSLDKSVYEAAAIDGVNWWTKFTNIEMPHLMGSIYVLLIFTIIGTIQDAGTVLFMVGIQGGPGGVATVPALFALRKAFMDQNFGFACAIGIMLTIVTFTLQKVSDFTVDWENKPRNQRIIFRLLLGLLAFLIALANRMPGVTLVILLAILPYSFMNQDWKASGYFKRIWLAVAGFVLMALNQITVLPFFPGNFFFFASLVMLLIGFPWSYAKTFFFERQSGNGEMFIRGVIGLLGLFLLARNLPLGWPVSSVFKPSLAGFILSVLLVLSGIPVAHIRAAIKSRSKVDWEDHDQVIRGDMEKQLQPGRQAWSRFSSLFLRGFRHASIIGVLLLAFLPFYLMLVVSLKTNSQFYANPLGLHMPFHWENWRIAWNMVSINIANSMFVSISCVVLTLVLAMMAAYFFIRIKMPLSNFLWNALILLMMLPTIANLIPLFRLLKSMNLINTFTALIFVGVAGAQVGTIFIFRNFIGDIPRDFFEAAELDGATHWQQLTKIIFPLSGPILATLGVMQFLGCWNDFMLPLIIMSDNSKLTVMVQLLRMSGEYFKLWGPLMAGYALVSLPVILLFIFAMKFFIRGMSEGGTKF